MGNETDTSDSQHRKTILQKMSHNLDRVNRLVEGFDDWETMDTTDDQYEIAIVVDGQIHLRRPLTIPKEDTKTVIPAVKCALDMINDMSRANDEFRIVKTTTEVL